MARRTPLFFNTAGPVRPDLHYCVPPLSRLDLPEVLTLIDQQKYFVLHAPRQTGKTSALLALRDHFNSRDQYGCLYVNVETGQTAREDVRRGMKAIVSQLAQAARETFADTFVLGLLSTVVEQYGEDGALQAALSLWCAERAKPLVLMLDEVDALVGDTLISLLRQLRSGYASRPASFPQSVILCGVRDVRDYRIHSSRDKAVITGGSAFNVKAKSLRLGDFDRAEMEALYGCHASETGQEFTAEALELCWELTRGQPWLVNALGYETCFEMKDGRDRSRPVTQARVLQAKERLILRRETHLDQLVDKLAEARVRRVIGPMLASRELGLEASPEDIRYVEDLGLIRRAGSGYEPANGIYREVVPRELNYVQQLDFEATEQQAWYVLPDGRLDVSKLLAAFAQFFRENSEVWLERFDYKEAGPHLLLQAFLQRIVSSGGRIEREYGLGRRRTDLLIVWPLSAAGSPSGGRSSTPDPVAYQRTVLELKLLHGSWERTLAEGLPQTAAYMDRCGATEGHLVVFDRTAGKPWEEKLLRRTERHGPREIAVWGM